MCACKSNLESDFLYNSNETSERQDIVSLVFNTLNSVDYDDNRFVKNYRRDGVLRLTARILSRTLWRSRFSPCKVCRCGAVVLRSSEVPPNTENNRVLMRSTSRRKPRRSTFTLVFLSSSSDKWNSTTICMLAFSSVTSCRRCFKFSITYLSFEHSSSASCNRG